MSPWLTFEVALILLALTALGLLVRRWDRDVRQLLEMQRDTDARMAQVPLASPPTMPDGPLMAEVLNRLLDAALPPRAPEPTDDPEAVRHQAEYEPPYPEVNDWTDPFFGLERETVGGLRPGEGIPGIGQDAGDVVDEGGPMDNHAPDHDWSMPDDYAPAQGAFEHWVEETRRDG